jgi:hypothetical protein
MSPEALLRITAAVAGLRSSADTVRVVVPYAGGANMWKIEQPGKFPSATKDAIRDIVKGHGGKNPKYEDAGLQFDVPADKVDSAIEDVKNLSGIDKAFKSLFNVKKVKKGEDGRPEEKADPKPDKKVDKYERKLERKIEKQEKAEQPKPEEDPSGILPDDPVEEWNEILDDFGVEHRKRLRKPTPEALPKLPDEKPAPKKEPAKKAPKKAPERPKAPEKKPSAQPSGRRRPGPPPKAKFLKSLDRMSQVVRESEDQEEIIEAVEDFLDGIRYDSWPEAS